MSNPRKPTDEAQRDSLRTLDLLILKPPGPHGEMHGYEVAESTLHTSEDVLAVEEGSLYPAFQPMLLKGWVSAELGRHRRQSPCPLLPPPRRQP